MPAEILEDQLYRIYDVTVAKTIDSLINRSPYHNTIRLAGFDKNDKEHLFILRAALMVRDLLQTPVELAIPWWDGVVINWKIRKGFNKVKIVNRFEPNSIWVPSLVGKIKAEIRNEYDVCIHLDSIYNNYYEGSCS